MRLISVETLEFKEFLDQWVPEYAILSHRWGSIEEEVSYKDYVDGNKRETSGYRKIESFREIAAVRGLLWIWVDTCCIDKSSSAELSEAINSMFKWYQASKLCAVHLADVANTSDVSSFVKSEWFTRGWTLQELLAPTCLSFFTSDWRFLGSRQDPGVCSLVSQATGIPGRVLKNPEILYNVSIARRMSWAANRRTSRIEDTAYSLLGIFDINMPLLYGEGSKAFLRLQTHIMEQIDDDSLFSWRAPREIPSSVLHGLLAPSPAMFADCGNVVCLVLADRQESPPVKMTSRGAELFTELLVTSASSAADPPLYLHELSCGTVSDRSLYLDVRLGNHPPGFELCCIALMQKPDAGPFVRTHAGIHPSELARTYRKTSYVRPRTIYIRTSVTTIDSFPIAVIERPWPVSDPILVTEGVGRAKEKSFSEGREGPTRMRFPVLIPRLHKSSYGTLGDVVGDDLEDAPGDDFYVYQEANRTGEDTTYRLEDFEHSPRPRYRDYE